MEERLETQMTLNLNFQVLNAYIFGFTQLRYRKGHVLSAHSRSYRVTAFGIPRRYFLLQSLTEDSLRLPMLPENET